MIFQVKSLLTNEMTSWSLSTNHSPGIWPVLLLQVTLGVEFQLARCHLRPKARTKASYLIESTRLRQEMGHKYLKGGEILSNKCTDLQSKLECLTDLYIRDCYISQTLCIDSHKKEADFNMFATERNYPDIFMLSSLTRRSAQAMGFSESLLLQVLKNKCKYVKKIMI